MQMIDETQIDLERTVIDPEYRRRVVDYLNALDRAERERRSRERRASGAFESKPRAA